MRGRHTRPNRTLRALGVMLIVLATIFAGSAAADTAGTNNDDLETPADVIHPNIHQNNGPGQNANPNGANDGGGNMHGIANNPGKSGVHPNDDGENGFSNQLETVHGGIGEVNKNADGG